MPNIMIHVYIWQTETPISQATVTVTGYPSVLTDASGIAVIPNVAGDQTHTITTQKSGYLTDVRSPYISEDYSTDVYLQLGEEQPPPSGGIPIMVLVPIAGIVTVGLIWLAVKK